MPNWCDNVMYVDGTNEALENVRQIFESDEPFAKLKPEPDYDKVVVPFAFPEIDKLFGDTEPKVAKAGRPNAWYDWRCSEWGTKWEPSNVECGMETPPFTANLEVLGADFQTAWAPPEGIYEAVSQLPGIDAVVAMACDGSQDYIGAMIYKANAEPDQRVIKVFFEMDELYRVVKDSDPNQSEYHKLTHHLHNTFEGHYEMIGEGRYADEENGGNEDE